MRLMRCCFCCSSSWELKFSELNGFIFTDTGNIGKVSDTKWGSGFLTPRLSSTSLQCYEKYYENHWVMGKSQSRLGFKLRFQHIWRFIWTIKIRLKRSRFIFLEIWFNFFLKFDLKKSLIATNQLIACRWKTKSTNRRNTSVLGAIWCQNCPVLTDWLTLFVAYYGSTKYIMIVRLGCT